jgi:hypothetical protein
MPDQAQSVVNSEERVQAEGASVYMACAAVEAEAEWPVGRGRESESPSRA